MADAEPGAPRGESQPVHAAVEAPVFAPDAAQPAPVRTEAPVRAEAAERRTVSQVPAE